MDFVVVSPGFLALVVTRLTTEGFITDDLVHISMEGEQKYMGSTVAPTDLLYCLLAVVKPEQKQSPNDSGVCKLDDRPHRRLDLIVVPTKELACALLYFTGSAYFNRYSAPY